MKTLHKLLCPGSRHEWLYVHPLALTTCSLKAAGCPCCDSFCMMLAEDKGWGSMADTWLIL